ncbi:ATP-binding protein [Candidatus Azambacteria bacterium]|nr:ATP-binding protein [Candidatus Azambacteria bacterium]
MNIDNIFTRKTSIVSLQEKGRVVIIYGPRRVGKTTMSKEYLVSLDPQYCAKYEVGDDLVVQNLFNRQNRAEILDYVKPYDVLIIDEAQSIPKIGIGIKMIIDEDPNKKIILTGSSSFLLSQTIGDALVGRNYSTMLLPLSWGEIFGSNFDKKRKLHQFLIYGLYPEILLCKEVTLKQIKIQEIISSYLFKDTLSFEGLKSSELLLNITKALAFQIGNEVSLLKLAKDVGENDPKKVARYVSLLEKNFIIKKVTPFSRNPRNEIKKKGKYYFYDTGIRNAIINRFQKMEDRDSMDIGGLWENYVVMELFKKNILENPYFNSLYFWRDKKGNEVDIIIEKNGIIYAYECKWKKTDASFDVFLESYPKAKTFVINQENIDELLS